MSEGEFREPTGGELAGSMVVSRPPTPYQRYMEDQGIPVYEAPGFYDVRQLELGDWGSGGVRGAFLVPDGTLDLLGMHVVEIPPGGTLPAQRHIYEEKYFVVEGEGITQVWQPDSDVKQRFEWNKGSLFAIPINANFEIFNSGRERALLIVGNTAPVVLGIFDNREFVFENTYPFRERFNEEENYYEPSYDVVPTPVLKRAAWNTNIIPDIVNTELPLDNQRSPGYRRIEPQMAHGNFGCFIGEHAAGRYSKAHAHESHAVLICVKGQGYTYNWPMHHGTTPWQNGAEDAIERVDYVAGGLVAAAPGGGNWFHQHFPTGKDGIRFLTLFGGQPDLQYQQYGNRGENVWLNADIEDGGQSIGYHGEDPMIRKIYQEELAKNGVSFNMPEEVYQPRRK